MTVRYLILFKVVEKIKNQNKANDSIQPLNNNYVKNIAPKKLKLLITIVNRNKSEFFMDILQSMEINYQIAMTANGTASTEMLNLLGLSASDKTVILSVIREDKANSALAMLEEKFKAVKGGKGIAFTVPMKSMIGVLNYRFLSNNRRGVKEDF